MCSSSKPSTVGDARLSETPSPVHTPDPLRIIRSAGDSSVLRRWKLTNDPRLVAPLIAQVCHDLLTLALCDERTAGRVGVALEEAILNAMYHGNLEISSTLKENGDEPFHAKVRERQCLMPYSERTVRFVSYITPSRATFVIVDEGPGFNVTKLPDPTHPDNLLLSSGRGLLLMRAYMDAVRYNSTGNAVTLVKLRSTE